MSADIPLSRRSYAVGIVPREQQEPDEQNFKKLPILRTKIVVSLLNYKSYGRIPEENARLPYNAAFSGQLAAEV
jgi:hypothetical protein